MRIADVDFILVPEWHSSPTPGQPDRDHWLARWQRNLATAEWLRRDDATDGDVAQHGHALITQALNNRATVVVTHGTGIDVLIAASKQLATTPVIGAFMVTPLPSQPEATPPRLGISSTLIASNDHPDIELEVSRSLATALGSQFVEAGPAGRIDVASGQGPWPEGLMRLGRFLKQLTAH